MTNVTIYYGRSAGLKRRLLFSWRVCMMFSDLYLICAEMMILAAIIDSTVAEMKGENL